MFSPAHPAQVFIAPGTTDMRKSINGLSILVADQFELNPFSGSLFGVSYLAYLLSVIENGILSRFCIGITAGFASGINAWKKIVSCGRRLRKVYLMCMVVN